MRHHRPRGLFTRMDNTLVRATLLRMHEHGALDRVCDVSNKHYICRGCGQVCCWCFGGADDPRCDDCVVLDPDGARSFSARDRKAAP